MADDFPTYEPHTLTDDRKAAFRNAVVQERIGTQWANMLEAALDDADYWKSRALKPTADADTSIDPEEHNILRMTVDIMKARQTQACEIVTAAIGSGSGHVEKRVQQLADALTAERAKSAKLQHALETTNAANARRAEESQLEPVGWLAAYPDDIPTEHHDCTWYTLKKEQCQIGFRRQLFAGPAEPLEVTP